MFRISLFKVGLVAMFFFILASNILNYVSIATEVWDTRAFGLWKECQIQVSNQAVRRERCFRENPPALIATGTALNILSLILILVSQVAIFSKKFKDSFALYFVIGAEVVTLLSLVFNSIGWFFVFDINYQLIPISLGWSFWLMTPSFACSIIAAIIGSSILGCTCVTNNYERRRANNQPKTTNSIPVFIPQDANDPQVLRL